MIWEDEMVKFNVSPPRMLVDGAGRCASDILEPQAMTEGSAGFDLRADISHRIVIERDNCPVMIPTGVRCEIPRAHVGLLTIRSSLAVEGIVVVNSPGIIDSDFRGEIQVIMANITRHRHEILPLERIAQLVVVRCPQLTSLYVDSLNSTERGEGGYGSTGRD